MQNLAPHKPMKRSERLKKAPPAVAQPKRNDLLPLLEQYDVAAPRYTSYPPATQFSSNFDFSRYFQQIEHLGGARPELSIYVHLPFCDTLCFFCGCTMVISNNRDKISEYLTYLKREISLAAESFEEKPVVVQMHWGGGSPTHLTPWEILSLGQHLRQTFDFSPEAEISIEIDPRGLTEEHVHAMRTVGFNRASIGVQDFDADVQVSINRVQPRDLTEQAIAWCREAGISSINLDLIYGLPYQTNESFVHTLRAVTEIVPDRIAVYNFAYVPWIKPHQKLISLETLPTPSSKVALLELSIETLTNAGYAYLGMDHFAKPSDTLFAAQRNRTLQRNFQGYSTLAGKDLLAFGMSAIGRIENIFAQNVKELPEYYRLLDEGRLPVEKGYELTADDSRREYTIMQLMCNLSVDKAEYARLFGEDFDRYFEQEMKHLRPLAQDGLLDFYEDTLEVTDRGRFFLRNIGVAFDAYARTHDEKQVYSRAI